MSRHTKALLGAFVAILALSFAVGTASANRSLEARVAGGGTGTELSTARLNFEEPGGISVECAVTLLATLSTRIPKIRETLIGRITGVRISRERCRAAGIFAAEVRVLGCVAVERLLCQTSGNELWRAFYDSFSGALPEIAGVTIYINNTQFLLEIPLIEENCLYEGRAYGRLNIARRNVTSAEALRERTILALIRDLNHPRREEITCAETGTFSGAFGAPRPAVTIALL